MQGIERKYCDVCINAVVGAWRGIMESSAAETLQKVSYGKGETGDTLGLDAITEITIERRLTEFDQHAILITEELDEQAHRQWPTDSDPERQPIMFFSDPTDRSIQLFEFIKCISQDDDLAKVGDLMEKCCPQKIWEEMFEPPACVTGSTTAITCVRQGKIVFSAVLNFITSTIFVATDIGVFQHQLGAYSDMKNEDLSLDDIINKGRRLHFRGVRELNYTADKCRQFVTFLGKKGYLENFRDSKLFAEKEDPEKFIHHKKPPGPPRTLYLSELQEDHGPVGFILANGEKIGEWMHWLSFIKYAKNRDGVKSLHAYEIDLERPWTKNGMLMSTSSAYSIFCDQGGCPYLDISRLRNFRRPSQFRCMLVVVPYDNERIIHVLQQHEYRNVTDCF